MVATILEGSKLVGIHWRIAATHQHLDSQCESTRKLPTWWKGENFN